jgi:two-component SAPR family response regulator
MVVDDDTDMMSLVEITLAEDSRIEILGRASTAAEAIEAVRESSTDLIILDHFIHGDVMGLQAAPLIKAVAPEIKILLFTSHDLAIEASREAAIDRYLHKSRIVELLPCVQELLGLESS